MEVLGIKIDKEILLSSSLFLNVLFIMLLLIVTKLGFGKEIQSTSVNIWKRFINKEKKRKNENWIADCKAREGWKQKAIGIPLKLENKHLRTLSFEVSPIGKPKNWRGGFIIGNERYHPESIIDTDNSLLFHVGTPPQIANAQYVWFYDRDHIEGDPATTSVMKDSSNKIRFNIKIDHFHILKVLVNEQQVYNKKIQSLFRNKVYLLAWGDHANCRVIFTNIRYSF